MKRDEKAYRKHLTSSKWKQFRKDVMWDRDKKCECCGGVAQHVHHWDYETFGNERPEDVAILCVECHEAIHHKYERMTRRMMQVPIVLKAEQIREFQRQRSAQVIANTVQRWKDEDAARGAVVTVAPRMEPEKKVRRRAKAA